MRILIADDQALVRLGIRSILLSRPGLDVCGEAVDGPDAIERARQLRPDLVLMDRDLTIINSLEATREIKRILPQTAVLILGDSNSPEIVGQPLQAGADAYISKSACEKDLLAAIA